MADRLLAVLLILLLLPAILCAGEWTAETWRPVEIAFTSAKPHANPFLEVDMVATFTGPRGEKLERPAFWDGGDCWKVRFAPVSAGTWTYTTSCNDPADSGLQGKQGAVTCVPYAGDLPIYRHGFLRVSDDKRGLAYRDGTPFFWLADTHWIFAAERMNEANKPGWTSQFKGSADRRVAQGFTVYQIEFFGDWDSTGGVGASPNLKNFRDNFDPKVACLAEKGMVTAATLGILNSKPANVTPERAKLEARMARYVAARYGAYPMTWLTYQECTANFQNGPESNRPLYMEIVRGVGRAFKAADAYRHPITAHSDAPQVTAYRGEDWLDFTMLQAGHEHGLIFDTTKYYDYYFESAGPIPLVQGEANYERLFEGSTKVDASRIVTTDDTREAAYEAMQCGSFGFTYGANGVWQATWGGETKGDNQSTYGTTPWYEGIDLPGADQMTHLKAFYMASGWPRLAPRPECDGFLTLDAPCSSAVRPLVAADPALNHVVAYFLRDTPASGGKLSRLANAPYTARWFDPRKGTYLPIGDCVPQRGEWRFPAKPDAQDWLLVLSAKQENRPPVGGAAIASKWTEIAQARKAEKAKNIAPQAKVSASSTDAAHHFYAPENAIGAEEVAVNNWHHWSNDPGKDPATAVKPAWLMLEWGRPVKIKKIVLTTMQGYETRDYVIKYRHGGVWSVFADAEVTGNTETLREHIAKDAVEADAIRFQGEKGSLKQPTLVRVLQLKVLEP